MPERPSYLAGRGGVRRDSEVEGGGEVRVADSEVAGPRANPPKGKGSPLKA